MEITRKFLDIEGIIASKNPTLVKIIPGFVIRYLKRIVHQDEMNGYIYNNRDKFGLDFIEAIFEDFGARIYARCVNRDSRFEIRDARLEKDETKWVPINNASHITDLLSRIIKPDGRYIIAANHPLGGLDGMALIDVVGKVRSDIVFPVNDILMNVPGLKPLFIPINKHGRNTENIRIIDETFASDKVILYFPAGLVSRKHRGGEIRDLAWKKTFISKAKKYQREVIPVHISGQNSNFFYNLANWRKRFGIQANIEMLFLVDEMVKHKDKPIRIAFGEPIPYETFDKSKTDARWAEEVKEKVYSLADK